MFGNFVQL